MLRQWCHRPKLVIRSFYLPTVLCTHNGQLQKANGAMHFSSFNQIVSNQDRIGLSNAQISCKDYMGLQNLQLDPHKICGFHIIWCKIKWCCAVVWKRTTLMWDLLLEQNVFHDNLQFLVDFSCYQPTSPYTFQRHQNLRWLCIPNALPAEFLPSISVVKVNLLFSIIEFILSLEVVFQFSDSEDSSASWCVRRRADTLKQWSILDNNLSFSAQTVENVGKEELM